MSVAASRPPTPVVAPAPLPAPTPADREPASHPFAELLRQNRGVERPPAEAAAKPTSTDGATTRSEPGPEPTTTASDEGLPINDGTPKGDAAGRARARVGATASRSAARASGPAERPDRSPERSAERGAEENDRSPVDASTAAANPALVVRPETDRPVDPELRFGSAQKPPLAVSIGRDADAAASGSANALESGTDRDGPARRSGSDAVGRTDTGRSAARARDGDTSPPAASFAQLLAEAKAADRPTAATTVAEAPPLPAAPIAAPETHAPAALDNAPPPQAATLPVPVDSPEFAAAFGVQVSVFVREGVQHAELHLNPAETGPVSIAITLEGSQAHVEFGADLAATRQAIENGLPALASALRDAGFTLAGGGVAQHSRSGGSGHGAEDAAGRGRHDRREAGDSDAIAASGGVRAIHRLAAGGIDLYA